MLSLQAHGGSCHSLGGVRAQQLPYPFHSHRTHPHPFATLLKVEFNKCFSPPFPHRACCERARQHGRVVHPREKFTGRSCDDVSQHLLSGVKSALCCYEGLNFLHGCCAKHPAPVPRDCVHLDNTDCIKAETAAARVVVGIGCRERGSASAGGVSPHCRPVIRVSPVPVGRARPA